MRLTPDSRLRAPGGRALRPDPGWWVRGAAFASRFTPIMELEIH